MLAKKVSVVAGGEVFELDSRETSPRSPTLTTTSGVGGSSHADRSSTSSDSAFIGTGSNTDHYTANDRHSADEVTTTTRISLPKGLTASTTFLLNRLFETVKNCKLLEIIELQPLFLTLVTFRFLRMIFVCQSATVYCHSEQFCHKGEGIE